MRDDLCARFPENVFQESKSAAEDFVLVVVDGYISLYPCGYWDV